MRSEDLLSALDLVTMAVQTVGAAVALALLGAATLGMEAPEGLLVLIMGLVRPMREAVAAPTAGLAMMAAAMARLLATDLLEPQIQAEVAVAALPV
jgi:hypothetical protein